MNISQSDAAARIDTYCEVWNEDDEVRRAALLASVWAEGATYTDPATDALDAPRLLAHIGRMRESRPGARVVRTSHVDLHHGLARFQWQLRQADGTALPEGTDFVVFAPDGRIERIVGFFGPPKRQKDT